MVTIHLKRMCVPSVLVVFDMSKPQTCLHTSPDCYGCGPTNLRMTHYISQCQNTEQLRSLGHTSSLEQLIKKKKIWLIEMDHGSLRINFRLSFLCFLYHMHTYKLSVFRCHQTLLSLQHVLLHFNVCCLKPPLWLDLLWPQVFTMYVFLLFHVPSYPCISNIALDHRALFLYSLTLFWVFRLFTFRILSQLFLIKQLHTIRLLFEHLASVPFVPHYCFWGKLGIGWAPLTQNFEIRNTPKSKTFWVPK